jgi:hypothetical protein
VDAFAQIVSRDGDDDLIVEEQVVITDEFGLGAAQGLGGGGVAGAVFEVPDFQVVRRANESRLNARGRAFGVMRMGDGLTSGCEGSK